MDRILPGRVALSGAEFAHVFVNGQRLDTLLATRLHEPDLDGLVPAWLHWWGADVESQAGFDYVRSRTKLQGLTCELPILLCPDDYDFACTCVIVEVIAANDVVRWRRFGLNNTEFSPQRPLPRHIGEPVDWFSEPLSFVFDREEYIACVREVSGGRLL
ncbi:hypothetical protein [Streptomyces sp. NPDC101165]|uniref:hypothetical protein n=1 Tax=Streptomyces sp. NPDC101165 TaxID=3366119 RepID=UPI003811C826